MRSKPRRSKKLMSGADKRTANRSEVCGRYQVLAKLAPVLRSPLLLLKVGRTSECVRNGGDSKGALRIMVNFLLLLLHPSVCLRFETYLTSAKRSNGEGCLAVNIFFV